MDIFGAIGGDHNIFTDHAGGSVRDSKRHRRDRLIFEQERVGLHNRPFKMYKFRSMVVQDTAKEKGEWTIAK